MHRLLVKNGFYEKGGLLAPGYWDILSRAGADKRTG